MTVDDVEQSHPTAGSEETPLIQTTRPPSTQHRFYKAVVPYWELTRLNNPTGPLLCFWPFAFGLSMAARTAQLPVNALLCDLAKYLVFSFVVHSFGCVVNDIWDCKLDSGVERTKTRPIASGRVSRLQGAVFALLFLGLSLVILFTGFGRTTILVTLSQIFLAFVYPLLKRVTYWPQAFLGFAVNVSVFAGWAAVTDSINVAVCGTMLGSLCCWTIIYDTIYACQDRKDDVKVGVHSTALLFGAHVRGVLSLFGAVLALGLAAAGHLNHQGVAFFAVSVGGTAAHLAWQFATVDFDDGASCIAHFHHTARIGPVVWAGLALDYVLGGTQL